MLTPLRSTTDPPDLVANSSLDVHTSKWIIDKLFKGDLIRGRTVLLVTHHVAMAQPIADFLVSLKNGQIKAQGSVSEALKADPALFVEAKIDEGPSRTLFHSFLALLTQAF